MKKIIIIDGNSLAYSNIPNPEKVPEKILYSSTDNRNIFIIRKFIKKLLTMKFIYYKNYHFVVVFDEKDKHTFRHELDSRYKSKSYSEKRMKQKEYVYSQIDGIKAVLKKMGIPFYSTPKWEADDLIGMLVEKFEKKGFYTTIISGDKDILQLISKNTRVLFSNPNSKVSTLASRNNVWDLSGGVWPDQVIDIKILAGDTSDNIKGLGIIREDNKLDYWRNEEAVALIKKWGSLENMSKNISKIEDPYKKSIEKGTDKINLNRKLVTIVRDWDMDVKLEHFTKRKFDNNQALEVLEDLNLNSLLKNSRIKKGLGK